MALVVAPGAEHTPSLTVGLPPYSFPAARAIGYNLSRFR
jgi:hypothetical protein